LFKTYTPFELQFLKYFCTYVLQSKKQFTTDINLKHATYKQHLKEKLSEEAVFLETLPFPERHTAINVAQKLKEVVEEYEIMDTVRMVSHDQGSIMNAAMEILNDELNW